MTTAYERGQAWSRNALPLYADDGLTPMEACRVLGDEMLKGLSFAQERLAQDEHSEFWQEQVDYLRGALSALD